MVEDFDDLEDFERKDTSHNLPVGWTMLFVGLMLWGAYYLYTYTPALGGWSQEQEYKDSVKAEAEAIKAVKKEEPALEETNPLAGKADAIAKGKNIFASNCAVCHGEDGSGGIGPSFKDNVWLDVEGDISDKSIYTIISDGVEEGTEIEGRKGTGGMPSFKNTLNKDKIWSLVAFIRSLK